MAMEDAAAGVTLTKAEAYYLASLVKAELGTQEYIRHGVLRDRTQLEALHTELKNASGV